MPATDMSVQMRTLGDPTRRVVFVRIVDSEEMTVGALVRGGRISQPAVSQHLKALRDAGLVTERREGRTVHDRAAPC
jgi:DNA-binding transcriptional ArsR family regulator